MAEVSDLLRSRVPGRIRVRHPALRVRTRLTGLAAELAGWDGMIVVEGNPSTGSLLLHYDALSRAPAEMEARVAEAAAAAIGLSAEPPVALSKPAAPRKKPSRNNLRQLNRAAKFGMMASLPLSLAALAVSKRAHAAAGAAFVALVIVHMTANRRYLLT